MPLHTRGDVRASLDADIYGSRSAGISVPKYRLNDRELRPDIAHALVRHELFVDALHAQRKPSWGGGPRPVLKGPYVPQPV
jgi:hypothetical protein